MSPEEGMAALRNCRDRIDLLDRQILDLLNARTRVVEEIGRIKQHLSLPIYEPRREDEVFANVTTNNAGPLTGEGVRRVFERIIDEMRQVQRLKMERDGPGPPEEAAESQPQASGTKEAGPEP